MSELKYIFWCIIAYIILKIGYNFFDNLSKKMDEKIKKSIETEKKIKYAIANTPDFIMYLRIDTIKHTIALYYKREKILFLPKIGIFKPFVYKYSEIENVNHQPTLSKINIKIKTGETWNITYKTYTQELNNFLEKINKIVANNKEKNTVTQKTSEDVKKEPEISTNNSIDSNNKLKTDPKNETNNASGFITESNNSSGFITESNNASGFITESNNQSFDNKEFTNIVKIKTTGAMSDIYSALHLGQRKVVIKRIKQKYKDNKIYQNLFKKEFDTAFCLEHQNIVNVYGKGEDSEGMFYYMEYVDGRTLTNVINQKPMKDIAMVKKIFTEILEALDYVHKKQIFHRDLKPDNILLTYKGDNVKIIDFGLATADFLDDCLKNAGSPKYQAPELISHAQSADAKSDIYSAGIILIEMLTGQPLITNINLIEDSQLKQIAELMTNPDRNKRPNNCNSIIQMFSSKASGQMSVADEINKFAELRKKWLITDIEFETQKRKLLEL